MVTKAERLREFIANLKAAPAAASHDEAYALIVRELTAVEDKYSQAVANPDNWRTDGRMYPPQADMARASSNTPGVTVYRNRAHTTLIAVNGALAIMALPRRTVLIIKAGADGNTFDAATVL